MSLKNQGTVFRNYQKFNEIGGDFSLKDPPPRSPSLPPGREGDVPPLLPNFSIVTGGGFCKGSKIFSHFQNFGGHSI